ncbi:hypothetical protein AVEN_271151-1 [Araneus ventricosus]|uniref:Uncharacterized protein n=1 Tax=Araneus ventricosus TaxID=182803 RepID=A0A4Y2V8L6_ARAVE|nr:hypothetical protein AVEN_271151-1 [Araneus ventricosus]
MNMCSYWRNLQKLGTDTKKEQERKLTSDLNNLSDAKTLEIIKIEDRAFLLSQREPGLRGYRYGNRNEACKDRRKVIIESQRARRHTD